MELDIRCVFGFFAGKNSNLIGYLDDYDISNE